MSEHASEVQPAPADLLRTGHDLKEMMGPFTGGEQHLEFKQHGGKKGRSKKQRSALKRHTRKVKQQYKKLMRMMRNKF